MIEIISIHIPKTAGQSFHEILIQQYGDKVDDRKNLKRKMIKNNIENFTDILLPDKSIIHGHLWYRDVQEIHKKYNSKLITWLRDPVERVISNYYYFMGRIRTLEDHPHLDKKYYSLMDYTVEIGSNKVYVFFKGIELEDFYFLGFQEKFNEGIEKLSKKLQWRDDIEIIHKNPRSTWTVHNDIVTQPEDITQQMKDEIRMINIKDYQIFEKAQKMYEDGYWNP